MPRVLISDNGWQFDNKLFRDFCAHFGIKNHYSSTSHPQVNGKQKWKIDPCWSKGVWPDELPGVYKLTG